MSEQSDLHKQYENAFVRYGRIMTSFIYQFTIDEVLFHIILNSALGKIVPVVQLPEPPHGHISMVLTVTRNEALLLLKTDPSYDIWAKGPEHQTFFPIDGPGITPLHKEIFWFCYFRGAEYHDISHRYNITIPEARCILHEATKGITYQFKK